MNCHIKNGSVRQTRNSVNWYPSKFEFVSDQKLGPHTKKFVFLSDDQIYYIEVVKIWQIVLGSIYFLVGLGRIHEILINWITRK